MTTDVTKKALIVQGGWIGHEPVEVAEEFRKILVGEGFDVTVSDTLDVFLDKAFIESLTLIVPIWTMGEITGEQLEPMLEAVRNGCGIAGCHGGMGDSFRNQTEYQYMVGGQWVAHPGNDGVVYDVYFTNVDHQLTRGMSTFTVTSEKYYLHVDPAIEVLAATDFDDVPMPVVWTKSYGKGKVYYCSLGHVAQIVRMPEMIELMRRGFNWANGAQEVSAR